MGILKDVTAGVRREILWGRHLRRRQWLTRHHPLRYLFLEVTRRCNYACAYCGSDCAPHEKSSELTSDQWIDVVRAVARDFTPSEVMIAITGGEPLIKPGIFDVMEEVHRLGFPFGMVTNGSKLDDFVAERLVRAGIGSISLSMDGPPELNDVLRGAGASMHVQRAVRALRKARFRGKLEIMSTIVTPVIPHLDAMRQHVESLGVPYWRLTLVMPIGRAACRSDLVPGPAEVRTVLEYIRGAREAKLQPTPEFCEEGLVGDRFEGEVRPFLSECRAGITTGSVLCDGRIAACPELGDAFVQGDIRTDSFKQVWDTRYGLLRDRRWTRTGICLDCDQYDRCQGGSLHLYARPGSEPLRCLYRMVEEG
jgi:radical SAM protein with 4Fe4S-binding SPASM domain